MFGFNYGSHWTNGTAKTGDQFKRHFDNAIQAMGDSPTSARLFTTVQHGTADDIIEAIQPAKDTKTKLLLGMWPRNGRIDHELAALNKALDLYGQDLVDLIVGISVGNEDLHRSSVDCSPDCADALTVKGWIDTVRSNLTTGMFAATMGSKKVGHVDTVLSWTSDATGIRDLVAACDFIGVTIYPFWGGVSVEDSAQGFSSTLEQALSVAGRKPIFVGETGWPRAGNSIGNAHVGTRNMQSYWRTVRCGILDQYDSWWFQLEDDAHDGYSWGIWDASTGRPHFDVSCDDTAQMPTQRGTNFRLPSVTSATSVAQATSQCTC